MKKTYITPECVVDVMYDSPLLLTASLSSDGDLNTEIILGGEDGTEIYNGEFNSKRNVWSED